MNKSALKNFAKNARTELMKKVESKAFKIGITEESIKKAQIESSDAIYIDGKQLSLTEKKQREKLIQRIKEIGFKQVVEEVAYTWFNRFIALRFMEVNNYLPTKVRVLSSSNSESPEPDIIKEALSVDLDIDKELVYELKVNNKTEELFKYLIIKQCNSLNKYLPFMFETIEDYKEILFPEGLLAKESFLRDMTDVTTIPESDWEQVEIIGWLYQYYIVEKKDQVFADLKKNIKISKENIPAATQLFTSNWIVRYMVENSLGRLWLESYPDSSLKSEWKYFLDEAEQEQQVKDELEKIRRKNVDPESITFLDPCCGSGHILVYAFDVFYAMYLEKGYIPHEIPKLILEKNLFGLDIDDRAAQLASFAVMMKAREKSRRVFGQEIKPNIFAIQESNWITDGMIDVLIDKTAPSLVQDAQRETLHHLKDTFMNAKNYGSILKVEQVDLDFVDERLKYFAIDSDYQGDLVERISTSEILEKMPGLIMQAKLMSRRYDVVSTNPPYMGGAGMNEELSKFVSNKFSSSKKDMFAVMIERSFELTKVDGITSMITMESWMFLSSFEELRRAILDQKTILNLIHMPYEGRGRTSLGINFGTSAFVLKNVHVNNYNMQSMCIRYCEIDEEGVPTTFPVVNERFTSSNSSEYRKIPGSPVAYWVSNRLKNTFNNDSISDHFIPKFGMSVGDGEKYIRNWFEVDVTTIMFDAKSEQDYKKRNLKWNILDKGGPYRKWYGNKSQIVLWKDNGSEIRSNPKSAVRSPQYFFKPHISWTLVTSSKFSARYFEEGFILDTASNCIYFHANKVDYYVLGLLNSKFCQEILDIINPTLNYSCGVVGLVPYKEENRISEIIRLLVEENISVSKSDWDSFETSWDFKTHPLIEYRTDTSTLKDAFDYWATNCNKRIEKLKANEIKINALVNQVFELEDEFPHETGEDEISISKAERVRDVKSFLSYAVGCMFGRYSLDEEGLVLAGGNFEPERYRTFKADHDNILPILSDTYFEDDIVSRFVEFVKVTFGEETLAENLEFIANTLGSKKSDTPKEAIRRYFLNDFFKDHVQTYKKKPIYWLFTSGKQKAFNCLIYMHRYDKTTLSRIRTDYLHELQIRLDAEKKSLLSIIEGGGTAKEVSNAKKELKALDLKIEELKSYDELLHHMADMQIEMDLDDGVAVNYSKFDGLLAKI